MEGEGAGENGSKQTWETDFEKQYGDPGGNGEFSGYFGGLRSLGKVVGW